MPMPAGLTSSGLGAERWRDGNVVPSLLLITLVAQCTAAGPPLLRSRYSPGASRRRAQAGFGESKRKRQAQIQLCSQVDRRRGLLPVH
jgi:hypothetical protein